jgi:dipeptidyl aminopeptidase/acylaminoacyl peptidase
VLIKQGLVMRPDWENVVKPVVDYALTRPEVDPEKIALMGISLGGYLAPRAASGEHRLAACIADPGQWDMLEAAKARFSALPKEVLEKLPDEHAIRSIDIARGR